eukprot:4777205-Pleurochrysis_carterae.AAC.3
MQPGAKALPPSVEPALLGEWRSFSGGETNNVHSIRGWASYQQMGDALLEEVDADEAAGQLRQQRSVAMVEATQALSACGLPGAALYTPPSPVNGERAVWELRTYQLQLGYETVPQFLQLFQEGLAEKLAVDDSGASELATLLYSDNGSLNVVIELWRHASLARSQESRRASRKATRWRQAINDIAKLAVTFDTQLMRPTPRSPWA